MVNKEDLIKKYHDSDDYLAVASMLKIVLYETNFEENYVFGATITRDGKKVFFLRHLEVDENNYIYFPLHQHRHYRKDFQYLHEPPMPPQGYKGKVKNKS